MIFSDRVSIIVSKSLFLNLIFSRKEKKELSYNNMFNTFGRKKSHSLTLRCFHLLA